MNEINVQSFNMLSVIGKGSYAKVILVRKKAENSGVYALKILKKKYVQKRKQEHHVMMERYILAELNHPFLVRLYHAFQTTKKLFFVLEYCPGGELFRLLSKKQRFTEEQAKFYAAQIILALEYLHQKNIIYREYVFWLLSLKPENILIDGSGYIRLTDFGLSKVSLPNQTTMSVCGTPEYLAPEVLHKTGHGKPVDWWCLGNAIYQMVIGLPPFYSKNRAELFEKIKYTHPKIMPFVSDKLRSLFQELFQKKPEDRLCSKTGANEIKSHPWFENINWNDVLNKKIHPPFVPTLKSNIDVSHFDSEFTECEIQSMSDGSPKSEEENKAFSNFSWSKTENSSIAAEQTGSQFSLNISEIMEE